MRLNLLFSPQFRVYSEVIGLSLLFSPRLGVFESRKIEYIILFSTINIFSIRDKVAYNISSFKDKITYIISPCQGQDYLYIPLLGIESPIAFPLSGTGALIYSSVRDRVTYNIFLLGIGSLIYFLYQG